MTSKEYIQGVLYNLEEALKLAKETNNKDLELDCEMQIKSYNQVLKDLEVLEILKKQEINESVIYLNVEDFDSEEDYNKVKEWLENGNNL